MEWQPIETAPISDQVEFLGWDGMKVEKVWLLSEDLNGTPIWVYADGVYFTPTHWMPLPEPPK